MVRKRRVNITVDVDVWEKFEVYCDRCGTSCSNALGFFARAVTDPAMLKEWGMVFNAINKFLESNEVVKK